MHVCARTHVLYEGNNYVITRIGARVRACVRVKEACVCARVPDARAHARENLRLMKMISIIRSEILVRPGFAADLNINRAQGALILRA